MSAGIRKFKETIDLQSNLVKRLSSHRYFPIAMVVVALLTVACLHIWQRVYVIRLVREVAQLRAENRQMIDDTRKAQIDIAALSMASRIEKYAADTLGLEMISANRLFTLVPDRDCDAPLDEFATLLSSIERVAQYLPVLTETSANADELSRIKFDSTDSEGDEQ